MVNKKRILLYTFFSVLFVVFVIGFFGVSLSLSYIQEEYVQLQLGVNRRNAESIARMLEWELNHGVSKADAIAKLQASISGTQTEKGFLCMFDSDGAKLVCHPDTTMIGMTMPEEMAFRDLLNQKDTRAVDIIKSKAGSGGFLIGEQQTDITYMTPVASTGWMVSAHENIAQIHEKIADQRLRFGIGSVIIGLLIALAATAAARGISSRYENRIEQQNRQLEQSYKELSVLHEEVKRQKEEIESQRDYVIRQRDQIARQHDEITAGIRYAQRIQSALLPPEEVLQELIPNHFILFQPRDMVSGDFYWMSRKDDLVVLAAADCTGHGVPGAFMSMLGISLLNEVVNRATEIHAELILNELRSKVIKSLHQTGKMREAKDGMDMALCVIAPQKGILEFAGANNPLICIRNGELIEYKADKAPIGIHVKELATFTRHVIPMQPGDRYYLFSDGYVDQIGGSDGRKFLIKNLRSLLLEINDLPLEEQNQILKTRHLEWRQAENREEDGGYSQVDDILVIGFTCMV